MSAGVNKFFGVWVSAKRDAETVAGFGLLLALIILYIHEPKLTGDSGIDLRGTVR